MSSSFIFQIISVAACKNPAFSTDDVEKDYTRKINIPNINGNDLKNHALQGGNRLGVTKEH